MPINNPFLRVEYERWPVQVDVSSLPILSTPVRRMCVRCEQRRDAHGFRSVLTNKSGTSSEEWCESCHRYYSWKHRDGRLFSASSVSYASMYISFSPLRSANIFPSELNNLAFECSVSHSYVSNDLRAEDVNGNPVWGDYVEQEGWVRQADGRFKRPFRIPSYHSQERDWPVPEGITLGVELETYCPDPETTYTSKPSSILGERDGSLDPNKGIEWVGAPATLVSYRRRNSVWRKWLATLRELDVRPPGTTRRSGSYGMHVSLGRQGISIENQLKFILFINNSQEFSELIAERKQNRWARYNLKHRREVERVIEGYGDKYSATNVQRHRIEVRIFKASVNESTFLKNIEYVHAALQYASRTDIENLSVDGFLRWLCYSRQRKQYNNLYDFLNRRGLLPV